jgi:hypothetical protein
MESADGMNGRGEWSVLELFVEHSDAEVLSGLFKV